MDVWCSTKKSISARQFSSQLMMLAQQTECLNSNLPKFQLKKSGVFSKPESEMAEERPGIVSSFTANKASKAFQPLKSSDFDQNFPKNCSQCKTHQKTYVFPAHVEIQKKIVRGALKQSHIHHHLGSWTLWEGFASYSKGTPQPFKISRSSRWWKSAKR